MIGVILFIVILVRSCIYFEKTKFIHIMNHPELIQEMKKIPLLLKIVSISLKGDINIGVFNAADKYS